MPLLCQPSNTSGNRPGKQQPSTIARFIHKAAVDSAKTAAIRASFPMVPKSPDGTVPMGT
jgi:hypothetical protein